MRILVFLLALLGAAGAGFFGHKWYTDIPSLLDLPPRQLYLKFMAHYTGPTVSDAETRRALGMVVKASYLLMLSGALGVVGGIAALAGRKTGAFLLLMTVGLGPGFFVLDTLVFTSPLILAGLLCLLISVTPRRTDDEDRKPGWGGFFLKFLLFLILGGAVGGMDALIISRMEPAKLITEPLRMLDLSMLGLG